MYFNLGKLVLSIPWKKLYHEPTVVNISDLHVMVKPNFDIKYSEEREKVAAIDRKKKQIENIEEARRREEERRLSKKGDKKEEGDSFAEKLATNVIKNLQVTITNIHVRYEDNVSDPDSPFALGLTLENLSAQTTDKNFVPQIIKEAVTMIYKVVNLDNFAFYWNSKSDNKPMDKSQWLQFSRDMIASKKKKPSALKYLIHPITASKHLILNTKPGTDMNIPKMFLSIVLEELGIVLLRSQYHGIVHLLESFERMSRNEPFRKYRPELGVKGNARVW